MYVGSCAGKRVAQAVARFARGMIVSRMLLPT